MTPLDRLLPLAAVAGLAFQVGSLATLGLVARSWWRLPPGLRGRAAGSFHRFGPRSRAVLGSLALGLVALDVLVLGHGSPGEWLSVAAAAGALAASLPALPLETRLVQLFYEAAGTERDREFVALQVSWDRWHAVQVGLAATALALALLG